MNIAICEDNATDRAIIRDILRGYMEQNGYTGEISEYESRESLLASFSLGLFDLVFIDIYMCGINGVETARQIREIDPACVLVFITSSNEHALEGFSVRASAYVLKPIRDKEMLTALRQCEEVFIKNARYIEIRSDRMDIKLPLIKIYYAETFNKISIFHTSAGDYKTFLTMEEIENKLNGSFFYRCHKSYIINMNQVAKVTAQDILMKNGALVPMRSRGRDSIRADIANYLSTRLFGM